MKKRMMPGEVSTYGYERYKCVETSARELLRMSCKDYCALYGTTLCGVIPCIPDDRGDGLTVHFVKMAPRKRRGEKTRPTKQQ